jgi:hypothetical protein
MIHFGILHATQRAQHTLPGTIASLHRCGVGSVTVFPDDGVLGAGRNLLLAIDQLGMGRPSGEYVCIVDDDLVFAERMLPITEEAMARYPVAAFSLWTIEQNIPHDQRDGDGWLHVDPHEHLWGGSVVLPAGLCGKIAYYMRETLRVAPTMNTKPDALLFHALKTARIPLFFHLPSLADHVGVEHSTLGNDHSGGDTRGYRFNEWQ